jgi:hypothetical protein
MDQIADFLHNRFWSWAVTYVLHYAYHLALYHVIAPHEDNNGWVIARGDFRGHIGAAYRPNYRALLHNRWSWAVTYVLHYAYISRFQYHVIAPWSVMVELFNQGDFRGSRRRPPIDKLPILHNRYWFMSCNYVLHYAYITSPVPRYETVWCVGWGYLAGRF